MMPTRHDTDPMVASPEENGHDEPQSQMSDRDLLRRVDDRSLEVRRLVDLVGTDVLKLTKGQAETNRRIDAVQADVRRVEGKIDGFDRRLDRVRRSADDSGAHAAQEVENLREQLAERERAELERERDEARAKVDAIEKARIDDQREHRKRRHDLVWEIIKWAAIAALAAGFSHIAWH